MENAGYVIAGWSITGVALAGYALAVLRRTRRAQSDASADGSGRAGDAGAPVADSA